MSFAQMKRDELYELAVENFAVEVSQTANKQQIIAALTESGVTWDMAKTFDKNAAAIAEAEEEVAEVEKPADIPSGVITTLSMDVPVRKLADPVVDEDYIRVPKGVDGRVINNVFIPTSEESPLLDQEYVTQGLYTAGEQKVRQGAASSPVSDVILMKMERENPSYEIRGYKFTRDNPFSLVSSTDVDFILSHADGFKIASPREAKEFYG